MTNIILSSDWSRDHYKNTSSEFTNDLQHPINTSGNWSMALNEIIYTVDGWHNVREGYNDIQIAVKTFPTFQGYLPRTIWYATARSEIKGNEFRLILYWSSITDGKACVGIKDLESHYSEWMALPADGGTNAADTYLTPIARFNTIYLTDGKWKETPCNKGKARISIPRLAMNNTWIEKTVYIPPMRYNSFDMFRNVVEIEINRGLQKIFDDNDGHMAEINKYKKFNLADYEQQYMLYPWGQYVANQLFPIRTGQSTVAIDPIQITYLTVNYNEFAREYAELQKWKKDKTGPHGYYMKLEGIKDVWCTITTYKYMDVERGVVTATKEFCEKTKFEIKFNRILQYQIGLTTGVHYDIGWINWPQRELPSGGQLGVPSYFYIGFAMPDLDRYPLKSLCVYCDIIDGTYVNQEKQPLLRMLPINPNTHLVSHEALALKEYRRINKTNASTIKIWLKETPDGPILDLSGSTYVKLLVKRDE
jgi:hypothetical protein